MVVESGAGDCPLARRYEPWPGEQDERARPGGGKLGLAVPERHVVSVDVRMAAEFDGDFEAWRRVGQHSGRKFEK